MAREYDPIEEAFAQQAATDALSLLNATDGKSVSKYFQSGPDTFCLRLSIVSPEQKAAAILASQIAAARSEAERQR